jgi:hypothetical protein
MTYVADPGRYDGTKACRRCGRSGLDDGEVDLWADARHGNW